MSACRAVIAGMMLFGGSCAALAAQTPQNPISNKPEGTTPNCTYSGTVTNGKTTGASACNPGTTPGTDPNLYVPPSASQRFPYPNQTPALPTAPNQGAQNGSPATSSEGQATTPAGNATQRFPFPGEAAQGEPPNAAGAPANSGPPLQDAGSSGSSSDHAGSGSSSSSSSSSSSGQGDPGFSSSNPGGDSNLPDDDPNAPMPTPRGHARKKLPVVKPVTPDEQEAEDVQVAGFYQNDGNYKAAYDRATDAVKLMNDDPDAHLALAEAARKLGKLDEAEQNYKKTLTLDPVPKTRRLAEKALKEMSGS